MKRLQKLLSSALACAMLLSCVLPLGSAAAKSFSDVKGHWALSQIQSAVSRGYVDGYENGTFQPNASVTRAEFCKMLNNAVALKNSSAVSFTDVSSRDWFYAEVCKSVSAGYIAGYEDGSFRANDKITRQEAAVVISRIIADPSSEKNLSELKDGNLIAAWAQGGAKSVFSKGYMAGDNKKKFNPDGNLTRGEAVKIIEAILGGEKISTSNASITTGQTVSNTIYTGNVSVSASGSVTFQNCSILGTLSVSGEGAVRLQDTKVTNLSVSTSSGKAALVASGKTNIKNSSLSVGASLTESALTGEGFRNVTLSGTKLSSQTVNLSGAFQAVTLSSVSNLNLTSGSIKLLTLQSSASGSEIDLASKSTVERAELSGSGDFTGKGIIYRAVLNGSGSTFETEPQILEGSSALMPTISPKNGASNVAPTDSITLTFSETPYTSSRATLTKTYVEDSVIELRRSTLSGTKQSFTASLSSNNRTITIKPNKLENDSKYFVIVKASLKNNNGQSNQYTSFSLTTGSGMAPTVYPANGADNIPVSTPITLTFPESVYQPSGSSLSSTYLKNTALELRSGSASGRLVGISASISSDKKTITISPDQNLNTNTKYYLTLQDDSLADSDRDPLPEQIFSFTTASSDILVPAMTPSPGSTEVAVDTELELRFDTAIYNSSGGSVTSSYLEDSVFTLRRGSTSGTATAVSAEIDSARKVVTLSLDSELRYDTTYYLIMDSKSLSDSTSSSRSYNQKITLSFTTEAESTRESLEPTISPKNAATGVSASSNITLTFDTAVYQSNSAKSNITNSYLENSVLELRSGSATGTKQDFSADISTNKKVITLDPDDNLSSNTKYYVIVKANSLQNSSGEKNSKFTSYFTCGKTTGLLTPTVTPADGATGVSPNPTISINFDEAVYDSSGTRLSDNTTSLTHIKKYAVQLRLGSETGTIVNFSVNSISSYRNITITPDSTLTSGRTYYLILLAGQLQNSDGQSNARQVFRFTVGSGLTVTTSPATGATGVNRTAPITLSFSDKLYEASSGTALTSSNVSSAVKGYISLTASGVSAPNFTVDISSNGKTITVQPTAPLEASRTYTLSLSANRVMSYDGRKNSIATVSFTTSATVLQPIVSPASGSANVSTRPTISLNFAETLYTPAGFPLKEVDVSNVIELREGSASGTIVSYTASVVGNKTINLTPSKELANSTRYYVILKGSTLATSSTATVKNAQQSFYFNTLAPTYLQAPSVSISAVGSDGKQDITLTFAADILKADKTVLDDVYLREKLKLSTDAAGANVVELDSVHFTGRTITLTTKTFLTPSSNYYISAAAGVFSDASGNKNQAISVQRTTPSLAVSLEAQSVTKDSTTLQVSYNYPIILTLTLHDGTTEKTLRTSTQPLNNPFTEGCSALTPGTAYTANLSYYLVGAEPITAVSTSKTFTTLAVSDNAALADVTVRDAEVIYHHFNAPGNEESREVVPNADGKVILQVFTENPKASVVVAGVERSPDGSYVIAVGTGTTVTITVTAENGVPKEYTLKLTLKAP